jgi:hypothetical protein
MKGSQSFCEPFEIALASRVAEIQIFREPGRALKLHGRAANDHELDPTVVQRAESVPDSLPGSMSFACQPRLLHGAVALFKFSGSLRGSEFRVLEEECQVDPKLFGSGQGAARLRIVDQIPARFFLARTS